MGLWGKLRAAAAFRFFAEKTERDFIAMALTGAVFLLPFSLNHLVQGRLVMGSVTTALVLWFVVNGLAIYFGRRLVPTGVVFLPALAALGVSMVMQARVGLFWSYPAMLLFHFVLGRRLANVFNAAVVLMAVPVALDTYGADVAVRMAATLMLTIVFANVFSYLNELQQKKGAEQERQLELERDRLSLLVHATQAGFSDWDALAGTVSYSERFKEILGYPPDADTSAWPPFFEMLHPEDRPVVEGVFRATLRRKRAPGLQPPGEALDYRLRRADGSYVWVHAESIAQAAEDGRIRRFITSFQDISKFREQESRLRDQAKFISDVLDSLPVGIAMRGLDGRYVFVNRAWEGFTGSGREEVLGKTVHERVFREEADAVVAEDRAMLERGAGAPMATQDLEFRGRRYMLTRTLVTDAQGAALGVLVASVDMTERYAMEKALATEQRRFELVVRAGNVGILDWDGVSRTAYYSRRFKELLGYPADADTSEWPDYFQMIHPEDRGRVQERFRSHVVEERAEELHETIQYRLRRADGGYAWVEAVGVSVRDENGYVTRFIASIRDITERRAQEEALRQSVRLREEVERMSRHDLKTPLNSVIAVSRLLREGGKLGREDDELLDIVERAGYRILNMVNLSLDLFRMEQGTYQFRPQAVDIADVADKVAADLHAQADSKSVAVQVKREASVGRAGGALAVRGEELLCYSMLANLVKNAIEAAPEGAVVSIRFERERQGEDEAILVHVHNPGVVHEAVRERFFEKYASVGKAAGLGIGTYSARLMARVQQGDTTMRTSEAEGTTVTIRLAAGEAPASKSAGKQARRGAPAAPVLPPLAVLVADDDEFNRLVLRRMLPTPPIRLATAVNGRAALEAAEREWPDVVFLDIEMPVMDGYEAARRLREMEQARGLKRCTIVAFSANDDPGIVLKAIAAGFDHYIAKPAPREALWALLAGQAPEASALPSGELNARSPVLVDADLEGTLAAFRLSRMEILDEMQEALGAGERERFRRLAHQVAGSCALYGFDWAAAQCSMLEADAAGGAADELAARVRAVRDHVAGVEVRFAAPEDA
jgi:PAS domain S-box-containing protein